MQPKCNRNASTDRDALDTTEMQRQARRLRLYDVSEEIINKRFSMEERRLDET